MADYLVFVDFDGVLTSTRVHMAQPEDSYKLWSTFDPIVMEFFNKIHNRHDVEFVWTTTWRNNLEDAGQLKHVLYTEKPGVDAISVKRSETFEYVSVPVIRYVW